MAELTPRWRLLGVSASQRRSAAFLYFPHFFFLIASFLLDHHFLPRHARTIGTTHRDHKTTREVTVWVRTNIEGWGPRGHGLPASIIISAYTERITPMLTRSRRQDGGIVDSRRRSPALSMHIRVSRTPQEPSVPLLVLPLRSRYIHVVVGLHFFHLPLRRLALVILGSDPPRFVILGDDTQPATHILVLNSRFRHVKLVDASPLLRFSLPCLAFVIAGLSPTRLVIPDDNIGPAHPLTHANPRLCHSRLVYASCRHVRPSLFMISSHSAWFRFVWSSMVTIQPPAPCNVPVHP
ncbi:hypothetical protein C8R42DRAFT_718599 [Lentinula raphanica]|nr:hypothetical protein C8R42DRAFT_718599 [Lentinula raphanica]